MARTSSHTHLAISILKTMIIAVLITVAGCYQKVSAQSRDVVTSNAKSKFEMDISLGVFGQSTPTRSRQFFYNSDVGTSYTQITQGTTDSAGVLGTFRQSLRPWLGYSVNLGYSRLSEEYRTGTSIKFTPNWPGSQTPYYYFEYGSIGVNMYELTGSYVAQGPRTRRVQTFAQLGAGVLAFLPTQDPSPYWVSFRPTWVGGAGMNCSLSPHWAIRAEYRGLLYKNPDFNGANASFSRSRFLHLTHEPTVSLVYRFGKTR